MNTIFCTATVNGTPVFVELTNAQIYAGSSEDEVVVFVDHEGEMEMLTVTLDTLVDIAPEN